MWNLGALELAEIVGRSLIVYIFLLGAIRLSGKRQIGQLTPFDLVVLLLISNAVQNAMTGPDTSVSGGIVAAATLLLANRAVAWARIRNPRIGLWVEGVPIVLIDHGNIQVQNLEREGMTLDDLQQSLREHDVANMDDVELAMLEVDGSVSVIRRHAEGHYVKTKHRLARHTRRPNAD